MMRILHKVAQWAPVAVLLALSLGTISCEKNQPVETGPEVLPEQITIGSGKDQFTVRVVKASGTWTSHVEYVSGEEGWISLVSGSSETGTVTGIVFYEAKANSAEEPRTARVVVSNSAGSVSVMVTQLPVGSESLSGEPGKWLELPETPSGQGCLFGAHDMNGDPYVSHSVSGVRNWSCWWSPAKHISRWVAYPLNNGLKGSGSRTDAWGVYDPCFPEDDQPNLWYTYGGYDRGHQIPSADRLRYGGSTNCNKSTYYPTNMTPQIGSFNSGRWADLEGDIRTYAGRCDTLYVVTGCEFEPSIGSSSNTATGFKVMVPGYYWKAVVAYKKLKPSTVGFFGSDANGYYSGCAFYLDHNNADSGKHKYHISIDDLEQLIGIDLFVNLPDKIGAAYAASVESTTPATFWK